MQILEKMESPHEDEQWRELYENVEFTDDVNGGNAVDKDKVIAARRWEMQFFKKMGVFAKVDRKEVRSSGGKIITTRWVTEDIAQDRSGARSNVASVWTCMRQLRLWRLCSCSLRIVQKVKGRRNPRELASLTSVALTFTRHANIPYSLRFQMKTGRSAMSTGLGV